MTTLMVSIPDNTKAVMIAKALRHLGCTVQVLAVYSDDGHSETSNRRPPLVCVVEGIPSRINNISTNGQHDDDV